MNNKIIKLYYLSDNNFITNYSKEIKILINILKNIKESQIDLSIYNINHNNSINLAVISLFTIFIIKEIDEFFNLFNNNTIFLLEIIDKIFNKSFNINNIEYEFNKIIDYLQCNLPTYKFNIIITILYSQFTIFLNKIKILIENIILNNLINNNFNSLINIIKILNTEKNINNIINNLNYYYNKIPHYLKDFENQDKLQNIIIEIFKLLLNNNHIIINNSLTNSYNIISGNIFPSNIIIKYILNNSKLISFTINQIKIITYFILYLLKYYQNKHIKYILI